ncbi:MAG: DUF1565 domain-containing protein [Alphaproteobacteria bacterium]|nr:DUF1565 domain-containing protein [Alphaproteobacteria bacterium]
MPIVTCAALALALANPASSGSFTLGEDCGPGQAPTQPAALLVPVRFEQPVTVKAGSHQVAGLAIIGGGNLLWRGGRIVAPGGSPDRTSSGPRFYGVLISRATNVVLDTVDLSAARKAVVVDRSDGVTLQASRCSGLVEDCMIVSASRSIRFINNDVRDLRPVPTLCQRGDSSSQGESRRQCTASGGQWQDGWHSDVLQMRDGVADVVASGNRIVTTSHGLTQMDGVGDRPLADVRLENNRIASGRNGITLTSCAGCRISGNRLTTAVAGWRSVIRPGQAISCGNDVPDGGPGREKCQ